MKVVVAQQNPLMQAGEEMFWQELNELDGYSGERYVVVDTLSQEVLVNNARLVKDKRKVRV